MTAAAVPLSGPRADARACAVVAGALLGSFGAFAATWWSAFVPLLTALPWLVLGLLTRRVSGAAPLRAFVALAQAHGAVLLGVVLVRWQFEPRGVRGPYAFGEHPILQRAGFPWPGVEGNGLGAGVERIPLAMGVDALLVNAAVFALVFLWLQRRSTAAALRARVPAATVFAASASLWGGWQLAMLFD